MAVIGMSEKGKELSEAARSEVARQIALDSQAVIDRYTNNGAFVFPLSTNIPVARYYAYRPTALRLWSQDPARASTW